MNWVDIVLVLILLLTIWAGYRRGFILGSLDLSGWAASIVTAYFLYGYTKMLLEEPGQHGRVVITGIIFNHSFPCPVAFRPDCKIHCPDASRKQR